MSRYASMLSFIMMCISDLCAASDGLSQSQSRCFRQKIQLEASFKGDGYRLNLNEYLAGQGQYRLKESPFAQIENSFGPGSTDLHVTSLGEKDQLADCTDIVKISDNQLAILCKARQADLAYLPSVVFVNYDMMNGTITSSMKYDINDEKKTSIKCDKLAVSDSKKLLHVLCRSNSDSKKVVVVSLQIYQLPILQKGYLEFEWDSPIDQPLRCLMYKYTDGWNQEINGLVVYSYKESSQQKTTVAFLNEGFDSKQMELMRVFTDDRYETSFRDPSIVHIFNSGETVNHVIVSIKKNSDVLPPELIISSYVFESVKNDYLPQKVSKLITLHQSCKLDISVDVRMGKLTVACRDNVMICRIDTTSLSFSDCTHFDIKSKPTILSIFSTKDETFITSVGEERKDNLSIFRISGSSLGLLENYQIEYEDVVRKDFFLLNTYDEASMDYLMIDSASKWRFKRVLDLSLIVDTTQFINTNPNPVITIECLYDGVVVESMNIDLSVIVDESYKAELSYINNRIHLWTNSSIVLITYPDLRATGNSPVFRSGIEIPNNLINVTFNQISKLDVNTLKLYRVSPDSDFFPLGKGNFILNNKKEQNSNHYICGFNKSTQNHTCENVANYTKQASHFNVLAASRSEDSILLVTQNDKILSFGIHDNKTNHYLSASSSSAVKMVVKLEGSEYHIFGIGSLTNTCEFCLWRAILPSSLPQAKNIKEVSFTVIKNILESHVCIEDIVLSKDLESVLFSSVCDQSVDLINGVFKVNIKSNLGASSIIKLKPKLSTSFDIYPSRNSSAFTVVDYSNTRIYMVYEENGRGLYKYIEMPFAIMGYRSIITSEQDSEGEFLQVIGETDDNKISIVTFRTDPSIEINYRTHSVYFPEDSSTELYRILICSSSSPSNRSIVSYIFNQKVDSFIALLSSYHPQMTVNTSDYLDGPDKYEMASYMSFPFKFNPTETSIPLRRSIFFHDSYKSFRVEYTGSKKVEVGDDYSNKVEVDELMTYTSYPMKAQISNVNGNELKLVDRFSQVDIWKIGFNRELANNTYYKMKIDKEFVFAVTFPGRGGQSEVFVFIPNEKTISTVIDMPVIGIKIVKYRQETIGVLLLSGPSSSQLMTYSRKTGWNSFYLESGSYTVGKISVVADRIVVAAYASKPHWRLDTLLMDISSSGENSILDSAFFYMPHLTSLNLITSYNEIIVVSRFENRQFTYLAGYSVDEEGNSLKETRGGQEEKFLPAYRGMCSCRLIHSERISGKKSDTSVEFFLLTESDDVRIMELVTVIIKIVEGKMEVLKGKSFNLENLWNLKPLRSDITRDFVVVSVGNTSTSDSPFGMESSPAVMVYKLSKEILRPNQPNTIPVYHIISSKDLGIASTSVLERITLRFFRPVPSELYLAVHVPNYPESNTAIYRTNGLSLEVQSFDGISTGSIVFTSLHNYRHEIWLRDIMKVYRRKSVSKIRYIIIALVLMVALLVVHFVLYCVGRWLLNRKTETTMGEHRMEVEKEGKGALLLEEN